MARDHAVLLAHTSTDKPELTATVGGLVQVHKVHIHAVPGNLGIKLGMELEQRLIEDRQAGNPHFGW
ncbi:hypothetical protein D3C71_1899870 [compost metagenome]